MNNKIPTFEEKIKLRESIKDLLIDFDLQLDLAEVHAKLTKARYDALLKEGFTKEQAIELCKEI